MMLRHGIISSHFPYCRESSHHLRDRAIGSLLPIEEIPDASPYPEDVLCGGHMFPCSTTFTGRPGDLSKVTDLSSHLLDPQC